MAPRATIQETLTYGDEPYTEHDFYVWNLLMCPVCRKPILEEQFSSTFEQDENGWPLHVRILHPVGEISLDGLPETVQKEYIAAIRIRHINPNAFAVLLGRLLDVVCLDRGAPGDNLLSRINHLAKTDEIPNRLAEMAHQIRALRNIAAHADLGNLEQADVVVLTEFCEAILEYVYRAPKKLQIVQKRISSIRSNSTERQ